MITSISFAIPNCPQINFLKKIGDAVSEGEDIVEYSQDQEQFEIDIAAALKVSPKNASKFLMKNLGDSVNKDEIIARREKGIVFRKTIAIKSLLTGKVFELDNFSGRVKIVGVPVKKTLKSMVNGHVKEENQKQIVIEFKGEEIKLKKSYGESFFAPLYKVSGGDEEVNADHITIDAKDKLLLGGHFSLSDLNHAMAVGVRGVVGVKLNEHNLDKFQPEKIISVGGTTKKISLAVGLVTPEDFAKLEKYAGKHELYFDGQGSRIIIPR